MRIKNVFNIIMRNYALTFKTLLFKLCVFAVFATGLGLMLRLRMEGLINAFLPVSVNGTAVIRALFSTGSAEGVTEAFTESLRALMNYVSSNVGNMVLTAVILVIGIFIYRFVSGISDCVAIISLDSYASSLSKKPYLGVLFEDLGLIASFQAIEVCLAFIYTLALVAIDYLVASLFLKFLPLLAPFFCVAISVAGHGLYNTMVSRFSTVRLVDKKSIKEAMRDGFRPQKGYFLKMFMNYSIISLLYTYLFTTTLVFTFGVGTVILIPLYSNVIAGMKIIDSYVIEKKKYFIDYDNIVVPKELRENDEQLLKDVDI